MDAVIKHLVETAQVKVEGDKPEGEEGAAAEGDAAEGGGEDAAAAKEEGAGDKPALPTFNPYESLDLAEIKELGKLPELILGMSVKHPYFGDIMKAQMLAWEFKTESPPESYCFATSHSLMSAAIDKAGGDSKEVWFSGLVGVDDFEELTEMATNKAEILFPGVFMGWDS